MPNNYEAKIIKKLMSSSLAGKSYKITNSPKTFIVIHNMVGTSESSLSH